MNTTIKLYPIALAWTLCLVGSGCLLKVDGLDAGGSNDAPNSCLLGTEVDAVGVEQSTADPECEVLCSSGWGHSGAQLPIAWTRGEDGLDGAPALARAVGLFENGRIIVAQQQPGTLFISHYEPDGLNLGGFDFSELGSQIYGVEIDSHMVYVTHGDEDGTVVLSALSIPDQQELWRTSFAGVRAGPPARGGGKLAFALTIDETELDHALVTVDLDGNPVWTVETVDGGGGVAFSPAAARIAVAGSPTRVYASDDGEVLDEFVHGASPSIYANAVSFVDEDTVVTVGAGLTENRFEGWLASDSMVGGDDWEQIYNRADSWCPAEDDQWSAATSEWFTGVTVLADGSLLLIGSEGYQDTAGTPGVQPWVAHVSASGQFEASDRGLWDAYPVDAVASPDGSAFVVHVDNVDGVDNGPETAGGYHLRKYLP